MAGRKGGFNIEAWVYFTHTHPFDPGGLPYESFQIDPDFGDGADFLLDHGYVVNLVRLTAPSYSYKTFERTIAGAVHETIHTLTGQR